MRMSGGRDGDPYLVLAVPGLAIAVPFIIVNVPIPTHVPPEWSVAQGVPLFDPQP